MQTISINQADLDYTKKYNKGNKLDSLFGIKNQVLIQLYYFFRNNKQDCIYSVNMDLTSDEQTVFVGNEFTVYHRYGIYEEYTDYSIDTFDRSYLIIVPVEALHDELSLASFMEREKAKTNIDSFTCIIERDYTVIDVEQYKQDYVLFGKVCNDVRVLNPGFYDIGEKRYYTTTDRLHAFVENQKSKKFVTVDIVDIIKSYTFLNNMAQSIRICKDLIVKIENLIENTAKQNNLGPDNVIIYTSDFVNDKSKHIYLSIAAFLTMSKGYHCYVDNNDRGIYLEYVRRTTSRQYNYLSDYLKIIRKFPNFAISFNGEIASLCIKDLQRIQDDRKLPPESRRYSIKLSVYCAKIDINSFSLKEEVSTKKVILHDEYIQVLDFRDYFDLTNPDKEICINEYEQLNKVVISFGKQLREKTEILCDTSLNCTNIILFKLNNNYYLGYVSAIDFKLPFQMKPFADNYKMSHIEFDITEFRNLYDTNLIFDADVIVKRILQQRPFYNQNLHFDLSSTAINGSILSGIAAEKELITDCKTLSFSDIGIWSLQTSQLREGNVGGLTTVMNINEMIKSGYLGYFGGMHPSKSIDMVIKPELWG